MDLDGQLIQVIIGVLIGIGYVVAAIIKKLDQWIQTHRHSPEERRQMREMPTRTELPPTSAPSHTPPPKPKEDLGTILMRELQKALREERKEEQYFPPTEEMNPFEPAIPPGKPEAQLAPSTRSLIQGGQSGEKPSKPERASKSERGRTRHPVFAPAGSTAAYAPARGIIRANEMLQSPMDVGRAVVLHEIFSPPVSRRKGVRG